MTAAPAAARPWSRHCRRRPVEGQPGQKRAHHAGVGQGRDRQAGTDPGGEPFQPRHGEAADNADQHEDTGDQAHLPFQVPAGPVPVERRARLLPGEDSTVQDVHLGHARLGQRPFGLGGAAAGPADQHYLVQGFAQLGAVLAEGVEGTL